MQGSKASWCGGWAGLDISYQSTFRVYLFLRLTQELHEVRVIKRKLESA